ncbi:MAG: hypothetical protein BMS9Abin31_0803 [Gammaproteobacteria bacterium]|nr:MAG: hypothetical protein BMS9Abin31_0803 [Gammaproteobacteria bacterium]
MASLRSLSDDYYNNQISFVEYREQRSKLLQLIDEELNGVIFTDQSNIETGNTDESLIDKALSFLKLDKQKETS